MTRKHVMSVPLAVIVATATWTLGDTSWQGAGRLGNVTELPAKIGPSGLLYPGAAPFACSPADRHSTCPRPLPHANALPLMMLTLLYGPHNISLERSLQQCPVNMALLDVCKQSWHCIYCRKTVPAASPYGRGPVLVPGPDPALCSRHGGQVAGQHLCRIHAICFSAR